jgi:hypothetical protein
MDAAIVQKRRSLKKLLLLKKRGSLFRKPLVRIKWNKMDDEVLLRLNNIASQHPFCAWFKGRDHDPL